MFQLQICDPVLVKGNPISFHTYLRDVIAPLPFWRSRAGAPFYEELCELLDNEDVKDPIVTDLFHEALAGQMAMENTGLGQLNPVLARAAIRYARVLYDAKKVEPKPKDAEPSKVVPVAVS